MKETDGLDCSTSGGTGLDRIDSNHGGAESVICGSGSGKLVKGDLREQEVSWLQLWELRANRGWFRNILRKRLERKDLAAVPVNQWIVVVEPIVSENECNGRVQLSNIKCYPNDITSRMADG